MVNQFIVIAFDSDRDVVWVTARDSVEGCKEAAEQWCAKTPLLGWEEDWRQWYNGEVFQNAERVASSEDVEFSDCYYVEIYPAD